MKQPRLVDRYLTFPTSVLDRRAGAWKQLRARWSHLEDVGRDGTLFAASDHEVGAALHTYSRGASRFDPALAHLLVHWYTKPGDTIIDPFAGGPIRGVVTHELGRVYRSVDLNPAQVAENQAAHPHLADLWEAGDATRWAPPAADLVLTCPPTTSWKGTRTTLRTCPSWGGTSSPKPSRQPSPTPSGRSENTGTAHGW